ncbi:MAG: hypothetical protein AABX79_00325 [Nanoarchaeota archaeon]
MEENLEEIAWVKELIELTSSLPEESRKWVYDCVLQAYLDGAALVMAAQENKTPKQTEETRKRYVEILEYLKEKAGDRTAHVPMYLQSLERVVQTPDS